MSRAFESTPIPEKQGPNTAPASVLGVDGCKNGWIAARLLAHRRLAWHFSPDFNGLLESLPAPASVLVDGIIGLPDAAHPERSCDRLARRRLGRHASRVFSAPPREALNARNYAEALALSRAATGKGISLQTFHLLPKIRELDHAPLDGVREAHPELAFARLNGDAPIPESKKTSQGIRIRLALLENALPGAKADFHFAQPRLRPRGVAADDCLDALVLCLLAENPAVLRPLRESPKDRDARGRPMCIWQ